MLSRFMPCIMRKLNGVPSLLAGFFQKVRYEINFSSIMLQYKQMLVINIF